MAKATGRSSSGYVYFIVQAHDHSLIKIGKTSRSPKTRLKELQTGNPNIIMLVATYRLSSYSTYERRLHRKFAHLRIRNDCEWFRFDPEIASFILAHNSIRLIRKDIIRSRTNPLLRLFNPR